ncbi:thioredoxin-disulfide reductase, partial [Dysosmobacter welbionis]
VDTADDGAPGLLQRLDFNGAAGGQTGGHLGLLRRVLGVADQHFIGLGVQGAHGLRLQPLALEHDGLGQRLLEHRQGDDEGGVDLPHQIHIAELHGLDHGDGLHGHVLRRPQVLSPLLQHHQGLIQGGQLELDGVVPCGLHIRLALGDVCLQLPAPLLTGQDVTHQLVVVVHIGLEHLLQLPVGLLDVCLVLLQLDIDLVHFIAHGVVLGEDFVQLLAEVSEQLAEEAGVLLDLFDVELVHDLGQRVQHRAGVIQLGQVHAVEYHVGALGDLVCCSGAEGDNGLQVVYLDLAGQGIHLRRVDQRLGHHLPV